MDTLEEDLIYKQKIEKIKRQIEELVLTTMISVLEKINEKKITFVKAPKQNESEEMTF